MARSSPFSPLLEGEKFTSNRQPQSGQRKRMCAPSSVGAIEPVGMTNASTTKARKMNARMKATMIDSIVSLMFASLLSVEAFAGAGGSIVVIAGSSMIVVKQSKKSLCVILSEAKNLEFENCSRFGDPSLH